MAFSDNSLILLSAAISAKTAASQVSGAVVWGISEALHEETFTDHRLGRFMNHNYAEYHVAANADIHDIQVIFVDEEDRIVSKQLGAKGVGEAGTVGALGAAMNAINDALAGVGIRHFDMPATPVRVWEAIRAARG